MFKPKKDILFSGTRPEAMRRGLVGHEENLNIALLNRSVADILQQYAFVTTLSTSTTDQRSKLIEELSRTHRQRIAQNSFRPKPRDQYTIEELTAEQEFASGKNNTPRVINKYSEIVPFDYEKIAYRMTAREDLANAALAKAYFGDNKSSIQAPLGFSAALEKKNKLLADGIRDYVNQQREPGFRENFAFNMLRAICETKHNRHPLQSAERDTINQYLAVPVAGSQNATNSEIENRRQKILRLLTARNWELDKNLKRMLAGDGRLVKPALDALLNTNLAQDSFSETELERSEPVWQHKPLEVVSRNLAASLKPLVLSFQNQNPDYKRPTIAFHLLNEISHLKDIPPDEHKTFARKINQIFSASHVSDNSDIETTSRIDFIEIQRQVKARNKLAEELNPELKEEPVETVHPWSRPFNKQEKAFLSELTQRQKKIVLDHWERLQGEPDAINYLPPRIQKLARVPGEIIPTKPAQQAELLEMQLPRSKGSHRILVGSQSISVFGHTEANKLAAKQRVFLSKLHDTKEISNAQSDNDTERLAGHTKEKVGEKRSRQNEHNTDALNLPGLTINDTFEDEILPMDKRAEQRYDKRHRRNDPEGR